MKNIFVNGHYEAIDGEIEYNLGMCYTLMKEWRRGHMRKNSRHNCRIKLRCVMPTLEPDFWKLYLELSVNEKLIYQKRIRQEAYDVLAKDKAIELFGDVEFVTLEEFTPHGTSERTSE